MRTWSPLLLGLVACSPTAPGPGTVLPEDTGSPPPAQVGVSLEELGSPIPGLDTEQRAAFEAGREVAARVYAPSTGLGPTYNADSCKSCHQFPALGGSGPRYRDQWLVQTGSEGALEDAGTNGVSAVRNFYSTGDLAHIAEPASDVHYARRSTPALFGVGLFQFVSDGTIESLADPEDTDGDGISGRVNRDGDRVGRFGLKAQSVSLAAVNRDAAFDQLGLTSRDIEVDGLDPSTRPEADGDGVSDPELSDEDQAALWAFTTWLAPPLAEDPSGYHENEERGAVLFGELGCVSCHLPTIDSELGPLPAFTDLLLHDMGADRADGIEAGEATGSELRTPPLWGVVMHPPYLHDGAADSLDAAILLHAGEAEASRVAYEEAGYSDQIALVDYLETLGGRWPNALHLVAYEEASPGEGEPGGHLPIADDNTWTQWVWGRGLFDRNRLPAEGVGPVFNAESCRACHQDPVLGGAGGIDTNVLRYGTYDEDGVYDDLDRSALARVVLPGSDPHRLPDEASVIEPRQPPTTLGSGLVDGISDEAIIAGEDPDDLDGDGISGVARILDGGELGRFGWKAQVPSLQDFAADALFNESGLTVNAASSDFTGTDDDGVGDPELAGFEFRALVIYLRYLAPPIPGETDAEGAALFESIGCAACHTPELEGVALYSDLLLHDVAPDGALLVDQESGVWPTEYRTPPLWGVGDTGPYLHDGRAETLGEAVSLGHWGEASASREALEGLDEGEREAVERFLEGL